MPNASTAAPATNHSQSTVQSNPLSGEEKRRLQEFLRTRENPFEILVTLQKADFEAARTYVPEVYPDVWNRLQGVVNSLRPNRLEVESQLPRTGVVTVLGSRGSGKTAMLQAFQNRFEESHHNESSRHIVVVPTTFEPSRNFVEYLYLELVRSFKEEAGEEGTRILDLLAEAFTRKVLVEALRGISKVRWVARNTSGMLDFILSMRGWRTRDLLARKNNLVKELEAQDGKNLVDVAKHNEVPPSFLVEIANLHINQTMSDTTLSSAVRKGFYCELVARALGEPSHRFFGFLYDGFTKVSLQGEYSKEAYVNELFQCIVELCLLSQVPILFAFDSLETFLPAESPLQAKFFDGLAQVIDSIRGLAFVIFAETGHWNELTKKQGHFVQQRFHQGVVGVPNFGSVSQLNLPAVTVSMLNVITRARMLPHLTEFFAPEPVQQIQLFSSGDLENAIRASGKASNTSTLRYALAKLRDLYAERIQKRTAINSPLTGTGLGIADQLQSLWGAAMIGAKIEASKLSGGSLSSLHQGLHMWGKSFLQEGQAGLVEVINDTSGDHPTFGQVTVLHRKRDSRIEKIAVGLLVGTGAQMPSDLGAKLRMLVAGRVSEKYDHMIILWPKLVAKDPVEQLPARTKEIWNEFVKDQLATRVTLRCVDPADFAVWMAIPKWRTSATSEIVDVQNNELDYFVVEQTKDQLKLVFPA